MTQNEIEELEGTLKESQKADTSMLRDLLDKIPDGIIGGNASKKGQRIDEIQHDAQASQFQNMQVSPREPEEFTTYVQGIFKQIMPVIEFHDDVMQGRMITPVFIWATANVLVSRHLRCIREDPHSSQDR